MLLGATGIIGPAAESSKHPRPKNTEQQDQQTEDQEAQAQQAIAQDDDENAEMARLPPDEWLAKWQEDKARWQQAQKEHTKSVPRTPLASAPSVVDKQPATPPETVFVPGDGGSTFASNVELGAQPKGSGWGSRLRRRLFQSPRPS
jgi:hypothetical protein